MPTRQLRKSLRQARASLSHEERDRCSLKIARNLANYLPFRRCQKIGVYMATPEEVSTEPLIELLQMLEKEIYLPVINEKKWRDQPMLFAPFNPDTTRLRSNRFGIPEPIANMGSSIRGQKLQFVCVPVVGFNERCDRIGMGGGYYDRTFSHKGASPTHLVGLAFEVQLADFEPEAHDVPMHAVITEERVIVRPTGIR